MRRNIKLTIEYEGTRFHGWQRQVGQRTVQGELEDALSVLLRHPATVYASGRTDRGVHSLGQVVSFRTNSPIALERIRRGTNALTGRDILVRDPSDIHETFHARHSARARHYGYLLLRAPSVFWSPRALAPRPFPDVDAMNAAAKHLVGEHDFSAFSCKGDGAQDRRTRVLYARWEPWERGLIFRIGAIRFLYKMVRCIVASCLDVGLHKQEPGSLLDLLRHPSGRGKKVAPGHGLTLFSVDYDGTPGCGTWGPDCLPPGPVL
ncbi:MAG: tRNA pseudouridine(38-40) synthase TruA [Candidatus Eisenbacteria sp.]|nr:tRNA pseudouridine(38-40) synthase TruA [Candidatus Eisenbacteria bacterium]